jgi:Mat/Ecp fimbriae major subunit
MKKIFSISASAVFGWALLLASPAVADTTSGTSAASVVVPVTVVATTAAMDLGSFSAGTGGTVTLTPDGSGGSVSVGSGMSHFGGQQEAVFTVTGATSTAYTFSVTSGGNLSGPTGSGTLTMTPTYSHNAASSLDGSGSDVVEVGASVVVAADQEAGAYSGTFTVTVNY